MDNSSTKFDYVLQEIFKGLELSGLIKEVRILPSKRDLLITVSIQGVERYKLMFEGSGHFKIIDIGAKEKKFLYLGFLREHHYPILSKIIESVLAEN